MAIKMVALRYRVLPQTVHVDNRALQQEVDYSLAGAGVELLRRQQVPEVGASHVRWGVGF